jgi:hypothetical protein
MSTQPDLNGVKCDRSRPLRQIFLVTPHRSPAGWSPQAIGQVEGFLAVADPKACRGAESSKSSWSIS